MSPHLGLNFWSISFQRSQIPSVFLLKDEPANLLTDFSLSSYLLWHRDLTPYRRTHLHDSDSWGSHMFPSEILLRNFAEMWENFVFNSGTQKIFLVTQTKYEMNPRQSMKPGGSSDQSKGTLVPCKNYSVVNKVENWLHIFIKYSSICFLI